MLKERQDALRAIKIARGQIDGVNKMIEEDRYCIDIANQLLAIQSLLKKAELDILQGHIKNCIHTACLANNPKEKIAELNELMAKIFNNR